MPLFTGYKWRWRQHPYLSSESLHCVVSYITTSASREHATSNLLRWRWKQYVPPKLWSRRTEQHGALQEDNMIYHDWGNLRPYSDVSGGQNISFLLQAYHWCLEWNLQVYYRRYKRTGRGLLQELRMNGRGLLQALRMNCHRLTTGTKNKLSQAYYRSQEWTDRGLLHALRMNCHTLTTGAKNELAEAYYRR